VGAQRILKTMRVHPLDGGPDARIVIESKGIYAVENFLIARRLMYWQVYLHKTVLAGDQVLQGALRRARRHLRAGNPAAVAGISPTLRFFLEQKIDVSQIEQPDVLRAFCALDDTDVLYSLKRFMHSDDALLADLSRRFIERDFFRTTFLPEPPTEQQLKAWQHRVAEGLIEAGLTDTAHADEDASYYLTSDYSRHSAYEPVEGTIAILDDEGTVREFSEMTDTTAIEALTRFVVKPYVCYPKEVPLGEMIGSS